MKGASLGYLTKEGFRNVWVNRLMSLASITVLMACLVIIGLGSMLFFNINALLDKIESQNVIMVYIEDGTTDEQIEKMRPDVQNGLSMTAAYLKMENARLKAEAEAQKQKDAAAAQIKKNRAKAPGSQRDSGGQRTKTAEDDFFAAFEK